MSAVVLGCPKCGDRDDLVVLSRTISTTGFRVQDDGVLEVDMWRDSEDDEPYAVRCLACGWEQPIKNDRTSSIVAALEAGAGEEMEWE